MVQIVLLLKRKPGMTHEAFKAHYESSHVPLAMKHLGHLYLDYRRNYPSAQFGLAGVTPPSEPIYDCVTVITVADQNAVNEFWRIASQPEIAEQFATDEAKFLDRSKVAVFLSNQEFTPPL